MSLDDIRARAKEFPCTTAGHTDCTRLDRDRLLAALDAIHERLERLEKVAEGHVRDPDGYTSGIGQGLRIAAASVGLAIDEALA